MTLLIHYVVLRFAGDFVAYFLGRFVSTSGDRMRASSYSWRSISFFLWVSWVLAVRMSKPKVAELPAA